jgi:hypothetical protein
VPGTGPGAPRVVLVAGSLVCACAALLCNLVPVHVLYVKLFALRIPPRHICACAAVSRTKVNPNSADRDDAGMSASYLPRLCALVL